MIVIFSRVLFNLLKRLSAGNAILPYKTLIASVRSTCLDMEPSRCISAVPLKALDKSHCRMTDCYISLTLIDNRNYMI